MNPRDRHIPVAYGQGYTKMCRLCGERIWMLPGVTGQWLAVDLKPTGAGNIALDSFGRGFVIGRPELHGEELFVAHQATCPPYLERQAKRAQDAAQMRLGDDA